MQMQFLALAPKCPPRVASKPSACSICATASRPTPLALPVKNSRREWRKEWVMAGSRHCRSGPSERQDGRAESRERPGFARRSQNPAAYAARLACLVRYNQLGTSETSSDALARSLPSACVPDVAVGVAPHHVDLGA